MMDGAAAFGECRGMVRSAWRGRSLLLYGGVFIGGLLARLHGIGLKPFWMDEVTTIERSGKPFLAMIVDALAHHHLPAYFVLSSWVLPFGSTETVLRLPSAVFGALSCSVLASVGRRSGGWRVGLFAGLLMAASPIQVQYGQEARPYALMILVIVVALKGLVELALDPVAAAAPIGAAPARRRLGALSARDPGGDQRSERGVAVAHCRRHRGDRHGAAAGRGPAAASPQLGDRPRGHRCAVPSLLHRDGGPGHRRDRRRPRLGPAADLGAPLVRDGERLPLPHFEPDLFHLYPETVPGFAVAILGLTVLGALFLRARPPALVALAAACAVLPLLLLAISLRHPVWTPRYVLWSPPGFFFLVACGLRLVPRRLRTLALAFLILLAGVNLWPYYRDETKPRWDLAARALAAAVRPGDLVLVRDGWRRQMMTLYLAWTGAPPAVDWTTNIAAATTALRAGRRVWAMDGRVGQTDRREMAAFLDRIAALGPPDLRQPEGRDILLMRFDPTTRASGRGAFSSRP